MKSSTIALGALVALSASTSACTTVSVPTPEGDVIGRTMELMGDLDDKWVGSTHSRGEKMGALGSKICGLAHGQTSTVSSVLIYLMRRFFPACPAGFWAPMG